MRNPQTFIIINDSWPSSRPCAVYVEYIIEYPEGVGEPLQKVVWSGDEMRLRFRIASEVGCCRGKTIESPIDTGEEGTSSG